MIRSLAGACVAMVLASAGAAGDVVTSNQVLRIQFTTAGPFSLTPDVLILNLGTVTVLQPYTTRSAVLFDGNVALGTAVKSSFGSVSGPLLLNPANSWHDPASPWSFDNSGPANLGPIRAGTSQGRIDWRPLTGSVSVNLGEVTLRLGLAASSSTYFLVTPTPTITSIAVVAAPCTVDADQNGSINPADISVFVQTWVQSAAQGTLAGDYDGNGLIEPADISLFVTRWFTALTTGTCTT